MGLDAGSLDRRISVQRATMIDDGVASVLGPMAEVGKRWAKKTDIGDAERVRASAQGQELTTRFIVRSDSLTRQIDATYEIVCEGARYRVTGTKEHGGRQVGVEITASTQPDQAS